MRIVQDVMEALAGIESGDQIYCQGMASTPTRLIGALASRARTLTDVRLYHLHLEGPMPQVEPDLTDHLKDVSFFVGKNLRKAVNAGQSYYLPLFLSDVPWFLNRPAFHLKAAFIQVSPPDRHGYVSLGPTVEAILTAIERAETVIAQINPQVPRTLGFTHLPVSAIDYAIEVKDALPDVEPETLSDIDRQIGYYVASLIDDRATLQLGIGKIPDAVLTELIHHQDLGIHSEMIADGVMRLAEAGVITGRYKTHDVGQMVSTFALGSRELYTFLDDNPSVAMRPVDYTNNTAVIRQQPGMTSINSAVEVDITGQVAAESIGSHIISGVGGQMDFVRGASLAPRGKSIIALPSRTSTGISRIVATLHPGAAVTTTRNHVQYVVTEYGIAELHGKTLDERAQALIRIAHPEDRPDLVLQGRRTIPGFRGTLE